MFNSHQLFVVCSAFGFSCVLLCNWIPVVGLIWECGFCNVVIFV